ncbi:hypothetical protein NEDG_01774 [Nematocida displodere]|uniref:Uncharacterized protein n=1 Tax=Nematocida displodere TaxID=1805483 RepID=A0A177EHU9_9MICR|nr:hypothetical protein NEDG_01774 [Nematocida displodere]
MPCLKPLDFPLPTGNCPELILTDLPRTIDVSPDMAKAIANVKWAYVWATDLWLWSRICSVAGKRIGVEYELHLIASNLDELEVDESLKGEVATNTSELYLYNNTETPPRLVFDSAMS